MRHAILTLALLLATLTATPAQAWNPFRTSQGDVDDGNELLQEGKAGEALEAYEEAREAIPERSELHFNIGIVQHLLDKQEASVEAFTRALELVEPPMKARVLFGLGTAYAAWALDAESSEDEKDEALPRWTEAAHYLERALRLEPDNEGALRNLELALLRVDPPCSVREDEYEDNDSPAQAALLEFPEGQQEMTASLRLCPEDEDWFRLPVQRGDRLFATATVKTDGRKVALELRSEDGDTLLRPPEGSDETITEFSFQEGTLSGEPRLHLRELADEEAEVDLDIRILPACQRLEDAFEDNDTAESARPITPEDAEGLQALRVCPRDDDWYAVDVDPYWSLVVIGQFQVEKGQPSIAIMNEAGEVVAERTLTAEAGGQAQAGDGGQGGAPLMVALIEPPAGRYRVRVSGTLDVEAAYGLQVQVIPPCPEGEDDKEDNDTADMATPFESEQPQFLRVCPGDEDWFEVKAQPGDKRQVATISFDHERGDLDLELYAVDGAAPLETSARSGAEVGGEGVVLPEVEEETPYRLRVFAAPEEQNFYLLQVQSPDPQPQPQDQQKDQQQDQKKDQDQKDQKKDQQKQDQQKKPEPQKPEPKKGEKPEPRDPMEHEMDQLDHNPRNLEAERARRQSPFRHARPTKPW